MSTPTPPNPAPRKHQPYVPENVEMKEFTWRAVLLGLGMTVILGAANAYLGLRAGQTIAATYPAAVIGMAVLRLLGRGTILEEKVVTLAGSTNSASRAELEKNIRQAGYRPVIRDTYFNRRDYPFATAG